MSRDIFCEKCGKFEKNTDEDLFCLRCHLPMKIYEEKPHEPFVPTKISTMFIIKGEVGYESPTTGRAITSHKARREDLARSECIEYDPEMKTDQKRRIEAADAKLDKDFDKTIDKAIDSLPSDKRVRLENEMASGLDVEISRTTV
jgi:hypothetical protein